MTTNPKVRAGQPYMPVLHRVDSSQLGQDDGVTVTPIQFAGDEPDEDGPEEMLAFAVVLVLICIAIGAFIAGWLT